MAASVAPRLQVTPPGRRPPGHGDLRHGDPLGSDRRHSPARSSGPGLMPMPLPPATEQRTPTALAANRHLPHGISNPIPPPPLLNDVPRSGGTSKLNVDKLQREMESMQQWLVLDQGRRTPPLRGRGAYTPPKLGINGFNGMPFLNGDEPASFPSAGGDQIQRLRRENEELQAERERVERQEVQAAIQAKEDAATLRRENIELRAELEQAIEHERSLAARAEEEGADLRMQHEDAALRLARATGVEQALATRLELEQQSQSRELGEQQEALKRAGAKEQAVVARLGDELKNLRAENEALLAGLRNAAVQEAMLSARNEAEGEGWRRVGVQLREELATGAREAESLRWQVKHCEERAMDLRQQLAVRPSAADVGYQQDLMKILQKEVDDLRRQLTNSEKEVAELESKVREEDNLLQEMQHRHKVEVGSVQDLLTAHLQMDELRQKYVAMEARCRDLQGWAEQEEVQSRAASEMARKIAERERELAESERELQELREQLAEAERQRNLIEEEELRLLEAARRDERRMTELRKEFQQSEQRAAELEALRAQSAMSASKAPIPRWRDQKPDFTFAGF